MDLSLVESINQDNSCCATVWALDATLEADMWTALRVLLLLALGGGMLYRAFQAVRTGTTRDQGGRVHWRKQPVRYWSTIVLWSVFGASFCAFAVKLLMVG